MTPQDRRRQRAIERTRHEILGAAASTFARKGFRGTTMLDIARAAGYTPPTLYSYFRSKNEIFAALLVEVQEEIAATYEETGLPELTFEQRLHLLVHRQLEVAERHRDAFSVFFTVRPVDEKEASGFDACVLRLAAWIRASSTPEERGGADPELMACALAGMMQAFVRHTLRGGGKAPLARLSSTIAGLVLHGVRGSLDAAPGRAARRHSSRMELA